MSTISEGGGRDEYGNEETLISVIATAFNLILNEMTYKDGEDFKVTPKEFQNIQTELLIDLQIQY